MQPHEYPCLADAISVFGLRRLAKECPVDWRSRIWEGATDRLATMSSKTATVGEALRGYGDTLLLPLPGEPVTRLSHRREQARLMAECLGDVLVAELGSEHLRDLELWLTTTVRPSTGDVLGNERVKDALGYAREVVPRLRRAASLPPIQVHVAPTPTRPRVEVEPRTQPSAADFAPLFEGPAPKQVRVAIALAATANLWEGEILRLNAKGLRRRKEGLLTYTTRDGRPARAYLPRFVVDLVEEAFPGLDAIPDEALLYARRGASCKPRSSIYRDVARACEQVGVHPHTLREFRRIYQQAARSRGMVSAVVRGGCADSGKAVEIPGRQTTVMGECRELALSWRSPDRPPYGKLPLTKVPKKRPRGIAPLEPEIAAKGDRPRGGGVSSRAPTTALVPQRSATPPSPPPPTPSTPSVADAERRKPGQRRAVPSRPSKAAKPPPPAPPPAYLADDFIEPFRGPTIIPTIRMKEPVNRVPAYVPTLQATDQPGLTASTSKRGGSAKASDRRLAKKKRRG